MIVHFCTDGYIMSKYRHYKQAFTEVMWDMHFLVRDFTELDI